MAEDEKTAKKPLEKEGGEASKETLPEPIPEEKEEEMGQTMMDIDVSQFLNKEGGSGKSAPKSDSPEESVDDLLKKKKKGRLGIGKIFGK